MAYSESILSRAEARLKQAQQAHRDRQDRQRRAIYQALPRTEEIDRQLRTTATKILAASLRQGLGREETLAPMTGAFLKAYHDAHYRGDNTVVALTGSFSQEVLEDIRRRFSALPAGNAPAPVPAAYTPAFVATPKPIEQNHLTLAFPGLDYNSPKRFALQLLSAILGGGVSSRLFQQVREQQGLCYSIYSFTAGFEDTGLFAVAAAAEAGGKVIGIDEDLVIPDGMQVLRARNIREAIEAAL